MKLKNHDLFGNLDYDPKQISNIMKTFLEVRRIVLNFFWVNCKVSLYHLHHISIWSLTFQLCQFDP